MQLSIQNLSKTYSNGVKALKNVNLEIPTGMFGLLGPNGAGKSTLMRTLATLQEADEGIVMLDNIDVLHQKEKVREILGYLPQEFGVYPRVSAYTLLDHFAQLKGISNDKERREIIKDLLHRTNLYESRHKNLGGFSGGMKQRFGIAQAMLGNPKLIIVDEPTAGLDPAERNRFHNLLSEIGENIIVILSTHIIVDVSSLCSQLAIINKGTVVLESTPKEAISMVENKIWAAIIEKSELQYHLEQFPVISNHLIEGKIEVRAYSESPLDGFKNVVPDLEDVYFSYVTEKIAVNSETH